MNNFLTILLIAVLTMMSTSSFAQNGADISEQYFSLGTWSTSCGTFYGGGTLRSINTNGSYVSQINVTLYYVDDSSKKYHFIQRVVGHEPLDKEINLTMQNITGGLVHYISLNIRDSGGWRVSLIDVKCN